MFWNKKLALKISTFVSVAVFVLFVCCAAVITVYMNSKTEENSYTQLQLQENKATNLALTTPKVNGVLIRPGEVFSFWKS